MPRPTLVRCLSRRLSASVYGSESSVMRIFRESLLLAIAFSLLSSVATGFCCNHWHMPSTCPQCFGYGYGPGYHAPMIRPCHHRHRHHTPRFVYAPTCGQTCHLGCGGYGGYLTGPASMTPQPMQHSREPTPAPMPVETLPPASQEPGQAIFFPPDNLGG